MIIHKRVRIIYKGTVQGVGFRWTAQKAAYTVRVNGWVKNHKDGSVEIVAEGEEEALSKFLGIIKESMGEYIEDTDINWLSAENEFDGFHIRY